MQLTIVEAIRARDGIIAAHHRPNLSHRSEEVLVLQYFGFELQEIASLLGTSENTVKNQLHQARASVVPPQLPPTRGNATFWALSHRRCCLATPFAILKT